ncbi:MAG TPA: HupE/UreJ family protein [Vicinamibacteria bacterium]|nr:HupE/UreJ family protein [Vicinamibacteria bacterium]
MSKGARATLGLLVAVAGLAPVAPVRAHDVPTDVAVQAFLKPEGRRLRLLVRVPLQALRDVDHPTRGPGYLDVTRADAALRTAASLWIADEVALYEDEAPLGAPGIAAVRVSLPSDRSFGSYEEALAHVLGPPLPDETELPWSQGMLDALFEYAIQSETSRFSIQPSLGRLGLRVVTALRLITPGGAVRAFELSGDPGLVRLDPRWHQAAARFTELGFLHILGGADHLLFLVCLVVPIRRLGPLIVIVTSFTAAHSLTLIASALAVGTDALWFPHLVETLIAFSIVYMALENVVAPQLGRRWLIAFGFGLVHGFGFSFALRETLQFAGSHLLTSLLAFNVGVEVGQLLVLLVLVPAATGLMRVVAAERLVTIVLSALVAHTAWHWMLERFDRLRRFPLGWPAVDAALLASATRWLMLLVVAAALVWLLHAAAPLARRVAHEEGADAADD